jgi:two-component system sensor histidine kinase YesM
VRKFIRWIKAHFLYKIRYQITIFLFFVTFLPVISIQLFNYEKTSEMLLTKNHSLLADNLQLTQNSINNVLTDYKRILFQMSTDVTCMDNTGTVQGLP